MSGLVVAVGADDDCGARVGAEPLGDGHLIDPLGELVQQEAAGQVDERGRARGRRPRVMTLI